MSNFGVKRHLLSLELHVQFHLLQRSGTFSLSIETRRQITCSPLNWRKRILTILSVMLFMFCGLKENSSANCMCNQQLIFIKKLTSTDLK